MSFEENCGEERWEGGKDGWRLSPSLTPPLSRWEREKRKGQLPEG